MATAAPPFGPGPNSFGGNRLRPEGTTAAFAGSSACEDTLGRRAVTGSHGACTARARRKPQIRRARRAGIGGGRMHTDTAPFALFTLSNIGAF